MKTRLRATAFSIMELMVAIAILIVIILAIAAIFNGASKSVSNSSALMGTLSTARSVQQQIERLVGGMDKNGFLVIRSHQLEPGNPNSLRFDQVGFISYGTFANRTGGSEFSNTRNPYGESSTSNAAHVWIGHLVLERTDPRDYSYNSLPKLVHAALPNKAYPRPMKTSPPHPAQDVFLPINQLPTGVQVLDAPLPLVVAAKVNEKEMTLGIHTTLLVSRRLDGPDAPGKFYETTSEMLLNNRRVKAYPSILFDPTQEIPPMEIEKVIYPNNAVNSPHITSSRVAVAAQSPGELMNELAGRNPPLPTNAAPEWDLVCYRFKALSSVYETEATSAGNVTGAFTNGFFRTHPIAMHGVPSFKVEWTDGKGKYTEAEANSIGRPSLKDTIKWYGASTNLAEPKYYLQSAGTEDEAYPPNQLAPNVPTSNGEPATGDHYQAVFGPHNRDKWPKALRFTFKVVDPNDRLQGGREFVQVVNLP